MKRILAVFLILTVFITLFAGVPVYAEYELIDIPLPTPEPLPDPADEEPEQEILSAAGLVNKSAAADIAEGLRSGVTEYQVKNRAGMEKLAEICAGGNVLIGYRIYQTADIDMGWAPFRGIGVSQANDGFRGTFDGNGFVIKNLFIAGQTTDRGAGLFNESYNGTFRNIGIASGLIIGHNATGAILGYSLSSPSIANCWNAATVVSDGNRTAGECFGPAGIVGRTRGNVVNCYNLGLIVSTKGTLLGGVSGRQHGGTFANNYNYGQLVAGYLTTIGWSQNRRAPGFNALLNADADGNGDNFTASNNFYRTGCGEFSLQDGLGKILPGETNANNIIVKTDAATGKSAAEFETLAAALNAGDPTAKAGDAANGYTLAFADTVNGYPVLTYRSGDTVAVKRLPAANAFNIGADLDFTDPSGVYYSAFFTAMKARAATERTSIDTGLTVSADVTANVSVSNPMDLLLLAAFTAHNNAVIRNVSLQWNIDCSLNPITPYLPPLFYQSELAEGCVFDGRDYKIRNLMMDLTVDAYGLSHAGLIAAIGANGVLRDLELESGTVNVRYTAASADYGVGVFAGAAGAGARISRCRNGAALSMAGSTNANVRVSAICGGGTAAFTIDNCYNTGAITAVPGGNVGVLCADARAANVYNGFNAGAVTGAAEALLVRAAAGGTADFANLWDVSGTLTAAADHNAHASSGVLFDEMLEDALLDFECYGNAVLAVRLNQTYTAGKGARQYYTVTNGKTVYGTAETLPRKITFMSGETVCGERYTDSAGALASAAPTRIPLRPLVGWKNAQGTQVVPETAVFSADTVLYAIAGPADTVSAALRDIVQLRMILDLDYYDKPVAKVTVTGPDADGENGADPISRDFTVGTDLTPGADGRYPVDWPVAPAQMTDPIGITVTYTDATTEQILSGYTVKAYLDTVNAVVTDQKLIALCRATLQYGACAQQAFQYKTDSLAAPITTVLDPAVLNSTCYDNTVTGTRAAAGLSKVTTSALIRDKVSLRMYITLAEGTAIEDITAVYTKANGAPVEITPAATETPGKYALNITGIVASDFGEAYTFTVANNVTGGVYKLKTGVLNYGKKVLANSAAQDGMKRLICAMKVYNEAALRYFYKPGAPNEMPETDEGDE